MRFLIIGASGFLGKEVFNYIKSMGYEVMGTRNTSNDQNFVTFDLLKDRIKNCVDPLFLKSNKKLFLVICAALSQIDRCFTEKAISHQINVEKTILLIKDLRQLGAVPVFISTSSVYSGDIGNYNEDSTHGPINEYGRHKQEVEQFLNKNVPEAFILRLDKLVSDDVSGKHMFTEWYNNIKNNQPIICIDQVFSPTCTKDVARSILAGCQLRLCSAYNVANPEIFARADLARQFISAAGKKVDVIVKSHEELNFTDLRIKKSYLDPTKFIKETGIRFTNMDEVIGSFFRNKEAQEKEAICGL